MDYENCPRCKRDVRNSVLFQCVRCFTLYCKDCEDTSGGTLCPKCKMSQRMVLQTKK